LKITLSTDTSKQIDVYISNNSKCKLDGYQPVELEGKRFDLPVYRLPISLLRFSIRNGRFAAEYRDVKSEIGRDLDPSVKEDECQIRKLLLEQDPNATFILKEDLKRVGQKNPGIVTYDGFVINGNRRMAILQQLSEESGETRWGYLEVSKLPKETSEKDLWRIEAGLQFSRQERLDYGPINELLKFKEGVDAGLTTKQIAVSLYGGFTPKDIDRKLEILKLIERYLEFVGKPCHYKSADGLTEHFIDLQDFLEKEDKKGSDEEETMVFLKVAFDVIRNDLSHMDLRKIKKIASQSVARKSFLDEAKKNTEVARVVYPKKIATSEGPKTEPLPEKKGKEASTIQVFRESVDIAEAAEEKDKPITLLKKAINSVKNVDPTALKANQNEARPLIKELNQLIKDLETEIA
jgi:hypothetical protein